MKKGYLLITVMLMASFFLTPGDVESAPTQAPKQIPQYGGILRIISYAPPLVFGYPAESLAFSSAMAAVPCIEPLVSSDNSGQPYGVLAEDWKITPDGKSITFTLRKGVKFHDGTDFNAKAAKWNMDIMLAKGTDIAAKWTSIDVVDDYTIRLNFKEYQNTQLTGLEGRHGMMVSPTAVEKNGVEWAKFHPVGTGPFKLKNFVRDTSLEYERFDSHWGGRPYLDGIKFIYIVDSVTAQMAFQAGQGDVLQVQETGMSDVDDLVAKGYKPEKRAGAMMLLIPDSANRDSIFVDKRVRKAIEYAIDREKIAKTLGYGFWEPVNQPAASHHFGRIDTKGRPYNPSKAKQLLAEAGYPNGFKTTIISSSTFARDPLVSIQSLLSEVGIDVKLDIVSSAKWNEHVHKGWNNALLYVTQGATDTNYCAFLNRSYSSESIRYPSLAHPPGLDELVNRALRATDYKSQKSLSQEAVKVLVDNATVVPLWVGSAVYLLQKNVHDTGFYELGGAGFRWTTQKACMSK